MSRMIKELPSKNASSQIESHHTFESLQITKNNRYRKIPSVAKSSIKKHTIPAENVNIGKNIIFSWLSGYLEQKNAKTAIIAPEAPSDIPPVRAIALYK